MSDIYKLRWGDVHFRSSTCGLHTGIKTPLVGPPAAFELVWRTWVEMNLPAGVQVNMVVDIA